MATPPKNNTSRGYYSPNARIQEGYYQRNNRFVVIKTSIANAIYFVSKNRRIGVIKVAQALISSLSYATRSLNRVKKSSANAIGYIVPKRIDHFFRYSTARLANLAIAKKTYKGTRFAISTSINLAQSSKTFKGLKQVYSSLIPLSSSTRKVSLNRLAQVIQTSFEGIVNSFESLIAANYYPSYWYKMNESSGAIINYGSTGTANNLGTTRNITYRQSSPVTSNGGYALSFNGSSSYAELVTPTPAPPPLDGITAKYLTLGAWVNFSSTVTSYIVSWGNPQAGSRQGFVLRYNSSTTALEFIWNDGFKARTFSYPAFTPKLNSWYYIYVTFVANGYAYLYVYNKDDSSLDTSGNYIYGNYNSNIFWANNPSLFIGAQSTSANFFQGSISEVTISFGNTQFSTISNSLNAPALGTVSQLYYNAGTGNGPSSVQKNLALIRASKAIVVSLSSAVRVASLIKKSIVTSVNLALNSKSALIIKTSISTSINLALNSKSARRIKTSKATQSSLGIASKTLRRSKKALATIAAVIKSNKILSLTAKVIVTSLAKTARRFGKSIKVVLAPSALFTRKLNRNKKAIAIQVVSATITRRKGPKRSAGVIVTYQIGTSKRTTMYRKAIANAVGLYKYSLKRIANIRTQEAGTVQPVSQINNYVVTNNNLDDVGNYSASVSETSVDYAEADDASAGNFNISTDNPAITYTEPDFPSGEDVIPT